MRLKNHGRGISQVEVLNISQFGIWIYVAKEYFLPYKEFPWFRDAKLADIHNVRLIHPFHLYWPALDVDLDLNSLNNLEKYSLICH